MIIGVMVVAAIVIAVFIAVFAATRDGSSSSTTTNQTSAVANSGQQTRPGGDFTRPTDAVRIGDTLLSGVSVRTLDAQPQEAYLKYVVVQVTIQNVGQTPREITNLSFSLKDSDGVLARGQSGSAERARLGEVGKQYEALFGRVFVPGGTFQGTLVFTILRDAKPATLEYRNESGVIGTIKLKESQAIARLRKRRSLLNVFSFYFLLFLFYWNYQKILRSIVSNMVIS
jgi:hypothetical protein